LKNVEYVEKIEKIVEKHEQILRNWKLSKNIKKIKKKHAKVEKAEINVAIFWTNLVSSTLLMQSKTWYVKVFPQGTSGAASVFFTTYGGQWDFSAANEVRTKKIGWMMYFWMF